MRTWKVLVSVGSVAVPFWLVACGDTASPIGRADSPTVPVDGTTCSVSGEKRPARDDCNECTCSNGEWACSDLDCGSPGASCTYDGVDYAHGESFQCDCNICWCNNGGIGGTQVECTPDCNPGDTKVADDGCNDCFCTTGGRWHCGFTACDPSGASCTWEGKVYQHNESFRCPTPDDCNMCFCRNGQVGSTLIACGTCVHDGVTYAQGETFPEGDGCNQCSCNEGQVSCTQIACNPCNLPVAPGLCFAYIPRFYFDSALGECRQFNYGGCQGNANNFETFERCQEVCPGGG